MKNQPMRAQLDRKSTAASTGASPSRTGVDVHRKDAGGARALGGLDHLLAGSGRTVWTRGHGAAIHVERAEHSWWRASPR